MSKEELVRLSCDYCHTSILVDKVTPVTALTEWIQVFPATAGEQGPELYCSAEHAMQSLKLRIDKPKPVMQSQSSTREIIRVGTDGKVETNES